MKHGFCLDLIPRVVTSLGCVIAVMLPQPVSSSRSWQIASAQLAAGSACTETADGLSVINLMA